jgi:tripartite-type tricarboxylate transporter receptor subunit TctC
MPDVVARFEQIGVEPSGITPKEFAVFQQAEIEKWKKVVEFANVRLD